MSTDVALFCLAVLAVVVIVLGYYGQGEDKPCKKCDLAKGVRFKMWDLIAAQSRTIKRLERDNQNLMTGKEFRDLKINRLQEDLAKCQAELTKCWDEHEDDPIKIGGSI